ncbi:MAG: glycosyltransferase family 2 protein [Terriglobia bacterium]
MISVVIPTYNEAAVIEETLRRSAAALERSGEEFELIVVDDSSSDGTAELAERLAKEFPVRVLRRPGRLGLATAVIDGWGIARGDLLAVMDADLQHPPEALSELVKVFRRPGTDLALASRYTNGGGVPQWSLIRRFISWGATQLASTVLPLSLADVTDPMSGMFALRKHVLDGVQLSPVGYKILLEVVAKGRYKKFEEVPYVFVERGRGTSKLGARQYLEYLVHLARLAQSTGQLKSWIRYGAVGLAGAVINLLLLQLFVGRLGWHMLLALPAAIQLALVSNFVWNEVLTFRWQHSGNGLYRRFLGYELACASGAIVNLGVTLIVVDRGVDLIPAAAGGVVAGGLWNFVLNVPAIWRVWSPRRPSSP